LTRAQTAVAPGFASRKAAADALLAILHRHRPLDELFDTRLSGLPEKDRALVRMLVATVLRRLGTLRAVLAGLLEAGLPRNAPQIEIALLLGAAQILFLKVPDHAAVDLSVRLAAEARNRRYAGLVNAVLRRLTQEGQALLSTVDALADTPGWLLDRWQKHFGAATAAAVAAAHRREAPLDLTAKSSALEWAERLGGVLLPNGTIRLVTSGPISSLPGYDEGAWWVQDAAAALPARLLGGAAGLRVADLCAAPGGKTAQLAAAGAQVVAVDRSDNRLRLLRQNLARLNLEAAIVTADATRWDAPPFDAVLLDAPCSATGTIRRHPDIPWQKRAEDITTLTALQARLLERAAALTRVGGLLVYATCSLEPEEGEEQIAAFLVRHPSFQRVPIAPDDVRGFEPCILPDGDLRTLPSHSFGGGDLLAGCDGFYSARLRRVS
jgi:16S rRNA (cytosine967-C5)-methyltransferase